jgi:hypothetical protein
MYRQTIGASKRHEAMETNAIKVAVVMRRSRLASRWQPYRWQPVELTVEPLLPDDRVRCLRDDPDDTRWLFPGFDIRLYTDEAEGYFLNIDSPAPCWFVMWRLEEFDGAEVAVPKQITLSYNEAARLMDGGEQVDTLAAAPEIVTQLADFVQRHYRPEPKKKHKKPSFEGGAGVERMAQVEGSSDGR